jgi:tRNA modification GTPase
VLDQLFQSVSGRTVSQAPVGQINYGHWNAEDVVCVRTSEEIWEIQCHGGEAAVRKIISDLGDYSDATEPSATSLNDLLAVALLKCRTARTAQFLLAQQQGVLADFLQQIRQADEPAQQRSLIDELLKWDAFATHLTEPWKIAVVGRPNAGKSSLVNALAGFERAIVFDQPGTTRDRLDVDIVLDGFPMRLIDTAGIRTSTDDGIEREGIRRAWEAVRQADLCLHIVDGAAGWSEENELLQRQVPAVSTIIVQNKSDLPAAEDQTPQPPDYTTIKTSATTGQGMEQLIDVIVRTLIPDVPDLHEPLPVLPELVTRLQAVQHNQTTTAHRQLLDWIDMCLP